LTTSCATPSCRRETDDTAELDADHGRVTGSYRYGGYEKGCSLENVELVGIAA